MGDISPHCWKEKKGMGDISPHCWKELSCEREDSEIEQAGK